MPPIPRQLSRVGNFDEKRNTSRVFPVPDGAAGVFLKASQEWAARNPAHAQWLIDGHPTLTEEEHLERFGEPWKK